MLFDHLGNSHLYHALSRNLQCGLQFLGRADPARFEPGRIEIDGDNVFALVQDYDSRPLADCRWESHRAYCDIQTVAHGVERIGVTQPDRVTLTHPYDADRDIAFYDGSGDFLELRPGMFLILWPHDIHMPCVARDQPEKVRKIVIKARCLP